MSSEYVELSRQAQGVLAALHGGTGNRQGWGTGTFTTALNNSGATIPAWSIVTIVSNILVPTTLDAQLPILGIAVGVIDSAGQLTLGDAPDGSVVAVQTGGRALVKMESWEGSDAGQYVYTSAANAGHALARTTRNAGAFGLTRSTFGSGTPGILTLIELGLDIAIAGPLSVDQEGTLVNAATDVLDFTPVLTAHTFGGRTAIDLAPELISGLVAAQIASAYGTPGTTVIEPTSDLVKSGTITYSSGTSAWDKVNGGAPSSGSWYKLQQAQVIHRFADPGLDYTYRIDSIVVFEYAVFSGGSGGIHTTIRDPQTGEVYESPNWRVTGSNTDTFTVRPWDSRPWTLSDLVALQVGLTGPDIGGTAQVEQVYITVNWTPITSVADALLTGGGGSPDLDGGIPSSTYGGITMLDGGTP